MDAHDYRHKIIIDPVHGDIGLSELETALINTPTFQRLRRLKQLGFASFVYPNASYSRFAHSLGVLHIASRVIEAFRRQNFLQNEVDVAKLRVAALLHDVGHYPYSHLMELVDWDSYISEYLKKVNDAETEDPPGPKRYPDHDRLGQLVITHRDDVKDVLRRHDIDPSEIAALIRGEHQGIPNLLHKSLDVDRMDYLVRDSLNTGVPYGQVDLHYILNNLEVAGEDNIVLTSKARIAAEHLLLARYFMFNAVYLHKTVFGFEEIVRRIILLLLQNTDAIYKSGTEIEEMVTANTDEFLAFHDGYLDRFIDYHAGENNAHPLTILCKAVCLRQPPKLIHEVRDLYDPQGGELSHEYQNFRKSMKRELEDIADRCGIAPDCLIWRETKDVKFEACHPFVSVSAREDTKEEEIRELIHIKESSGETTSLIEDKKSIAYHLSRLTLKIIRLYAVESDPKKLTALESAVDAVL